ncbi:MAG: diaminobutyrate--2-oxoglutarate transaminase [Tenericutes bacterium]|nr:diaminobutyrate--2-oxoglutarate transaminase [Mycoplasmatota bacterium]
MNKKETFEKYESEVRSYCRVFSEVMTTAKGSIIKDENNKEYVDFFAGAGALNYGHNNDYIKEKLIEYLKNDGIIHSLDMFTEAKEDFINYFEKEILEKRNLNYKIMFTGPTGTNSIEAALKLARKVKNRSNVFAFMGAFHGMSLGALALTTDLSSRKGAGVDLNNVTHIPAPYMFKNLDVINYIKTILHDDHSGVEKPAAIVIETVQAEGGVYIFEKKFLKELRELCNEEDILLIIDDIQVGNARTGKFFSFENSGIVPDILTLSKSIGGYGLPFSLTLFKPELDIWSPGEHNGTFRGAQLSIVAAKAGLEYMLKENVEKEVERKSKIVKDFLKSINSKNIVDIRGIGLIWGVEFKSENQSKQVVTECFKNGLIIERAGRDNVVVKLMPPLVIEDHILLKGLEILKNSILKLE